MTTPKELCSLVAERVMELELIGASENEIGIWCAKNTDPPRFESTPVHWQPLESWADAGRVIQRVRENWDASQQYRFGLELLRIITTEVGFNGLVVGCQLLCLITPRAISLAALRAVGVEVE